MKVKVIQNGTKLLILLATVGVKTLEKKSEHKRLNASQHLTKLPKCTYLISIEQ